MEVTREFLPYGLAYITNTNEANGIGEKTSNGNKGRVLLPWMERTQDNVDFRNACGEKYLKDNVMKSRSVLRSEK